MWILSHSWLLAPKAATPEWGCTGGSARRVKPPSEQKNKFHLVPGTKRQPAKPPARAPAQRTHCFLKFQLVAASIYKSTSSPHPRARSRIHKWQRDIRVPRIGIWKCLCTRGTQPPRAASWKALGLVLHPRLPFRAGIALQGVKRRQARRHRVKAQTGAGILLRCLTSANCLWDSAVSAVCPASPRHCWDPILKCQAGSGERLID